MVCFVKILIIGGTNFIGPNVVKQLNSMGNHEIVLFHRGQVVCELPSVKHIYGNKMQMDRFKDDFKKLMPDIVVDMIAQKEDRVYGTKIFKVMWEGTMLNAALWSYGADFACDDDTVAEGYLDSQVFIEYATKVQGIVKDGDIFSIRCIRSRMGRSFKLLLKVIQ